jgi:hypothetical protein
MPVVIKRFLRHLQRPKKFEKIEKTRTKKEMAAGTEGIIAKGRKTRP